MNVAAKLESIALPSLLTLGLALCLATFAAMLR